MYPVTGLDQVRVAWVHLQGESYSLFGFLLYADPDRAIIDYMRDGIVELDKISGESCAIFVIEAPSKKWIAYSQKTGHTWWRMYGEEVLRELEPGSPPAYPGERSNKIDLFAKTIVENNQDCIIVVGDSNTTLQHLMQPEPSLIFDRVEAYRVARHFNLRFDELPCLIFFQDINSNVIWKSPLRRLISQVEVRDFFRDFFSSKEFLSLLR